MAELGNIGADARTAVAQGTYAPTLSQIGVAVTGLTLGGYPMQWTRTIKLVTVTFYFEFTTSVGGGTTVVAFDPPPGLPIADDLGLGALTVNGGSMQSEHATLSTDSVGQKIDVAFTTLAGANGASAEGTISYLTP